MRRLVAISAVLAAAVVLVACTGDVAPGAQPSPDRPVEVVTWWAAGSEKRGLDALVGVFDEQHPEHSFEGGAVAGGAGTAAKRQLKTRLLAGDPPDTFQAHAGAELTDYITAGQLEDVSALYDDFGLRRAFPTDLIRLLQVDGKIYSVPAGIHRSNMVWANPGVLAAAGVDPNATYGSIAAWFPALDAVRASGRTALAVGTTWTQVNLLETVLMADLGAERYEGLWTGTTDWSGREVTAALADFQTLMSYAPADRDDLDWPDTTQQVIDGAAGFTVMGDWAVAAFEEHGEVPGVDFSYFPVPGTVGIFGFLADSFTLPMGAKNRAGAAAWLDTVGSVEGQTAFNRAKGSIPARSDADPADFSSYQQSSIRAFGRDRIVPSLTHGAATSNAVLEAITAATATFTAGGSDLATYQAALADAATP
ncbi:ABC transporter substrate-binding protein [Pengzhenrongella frigida]|uniref:Probable sugar-binding periplasmic protein n=1 Tax=Pengzhenrongella frigida TaxID=1259133 RepID=A0A4Q5N0T6_9MICO|nr:ABC transporter substrate-binding protein [Cellulomonas sp. HLT2-17]RYV51655.1 carbohydrate ABC transporter substrate-binding protein [Cellulomonas sp. HLT2-17]